ncbi:helix-turn-helix transcriptional regulator [Marivibrio halodurans]|uniref:Helix-turn-helix transcriptional regulator n=1 Tax=Marivibrio halodurans TaxID=2039722 RepID=A0A8J7V182_9PROT|nr:helix-turn-helix transcriptional regulator [Marivibrio halodurans]MBP5857536.1 helix-turn-helix transcriptional regulator [Marivibrio halodurans]
MPDRIDAHVGRQLRAVREARGFSQVQLGQAVGLSNQQIQKYENGANRIGASRLWQFATLLNVNIETFYAGLDTEDVNSPASDIARSAARERRLRGIALDLERIESEALRDQIHSLILAAQGRGEGAPKPSDDDDGSGAVNNRRDAA